MIHTDALVIGAGPVGLFQVFQLGLLGLKAEIIDVLPHAGGQCMALYPDKPIYDIPGVPVCTGRELTQQLLKQAAPFMPPAENGGATGQPTSRIARNAHLGQMVSELRVLPEGGFEIHTDKGLQARARAVFIAAGAGAFVPRGLNLPGLDGAHNVHYFLPEQNDAAAPWAGQHLVVHGGGDEALSAALDLVQHPDPNQRPARLSILHRRDQFQADDALDQQVRALMASGEIELLVGMPVAAHVDDGGQADEANDGNGITRAAEGKRSRLTALQLLGADGQTRTQPLDHLLVRLGMSPKLGPLTTWGVALERKQVAVSPASFESSIPGIYAVGDINTYPGKKRLLLCGFHEATLAAHHAAAALHPDAPQHLLYTTTSPLLHQRLGIAGMAK